MVVGLGPEYNYDPKDHSIWLNNTTRYASNHGASLISRTLMDMFDADYVDDFTDPGKYQEQYDLCILAFATHITTWRDVSEYTRFVKELGIKTVAFSLGIQDFSQSTGEVNILHPSMKELLEYVLKTSSKIGVRGPNTASVLIKSGFNYRDIVNLGCPTLFRFLDRELKIDKPDSFSRPLIVFQRTMAGLNQKLLSSATLLGQDFLDEAVFTDNLSKENPTIKNELGAYEKLVNGAFTLGLIKQHGVFPRTFDSWYSEISQHDFVLGARLHGCIAALIQGIPAVMIARDARVIEIAEFFKIPYVKYADVMDQRIEDIYDQADFSSFNKLYGQRFDNFIRLLKRNNLTDRLSKPVNTDITDEFVYSEEDLHANYEIIFRELGGVQQKVNYMSRIVNKFERAYLKLEMIPGVKSIRRMLN